MEAVSGVRSFGFLRMAVRAELEPRWVSFSSPRCELVQHLLGRTLYSLSARERDQLCS